ncbi:MAG: hypothetical protein M9894_28115 [Planctomycetes bacterium]|nr:hypothetical protein [Planctomycetota bacterium]
MSARTRARTAARATSSGPPPPAAAPRGGVAYLVAAGRAVPPLVGGAGPGGAPPPRRPPLEDDAVALPVPPPRAMGVDVGLGPPTRATGGGAGPEALLVAHADQVAALIAARRFREARALEDALPAAVLADPRRRERVEALRRQLDDAHRAAVARERHATLDLVRGGDVALARRAVRDALAWVLDDARAQLARDLDEALRQRHAPLAALAQEKEVALDEVEERVRALLGEDGCDLVFFPNGAVALDYALAPAALARDLRLVGADPEDGPRVDAIGRRLTLVHVLPLAQTCEVAVDLEALRVGQRGHVALVVGAPSERPTQLTPGLGWDGAPVHVTPEGGVERAPDEPRPVAAGAVVRVRIEVTPGPAPGITLAGVVEDRKTGERLEVPPRAWPARRGSAGRVALVLQDVDVRLRGLQVRGLVSQ